MSPLSEIAEPSASKKAAVIFCREAVKYLEKNYNLVSLKTLPSAFKVANKKIRELNKNTDDPLTAVASLVAVKNNKIFAARLTDCGLTLIRNGKIIFKTPEFWSELKNKKGTAYGVIGKDDRQLKFIDFWTLDYQSGDFLILFSDGFENHFSQKNFLSVFKGNHLKEIADQIKSVDEKLILKNNEKYGSERTILLTKLN